MSAWPPPPDLDSVRELVRAADPEGYIAEGGPADEYDPEEEAIFAGIAHLPTAELIPAKLLPIIERVWRNSFELEDGAQGKAGPGLRTLAEQIARFFGPEAQPQVRNETHELPREPHG